MRAVARLAIVALHVAIVGGLTGCLATSPGYIVTAAPIAVRRGPGGLCIAIEPTNPRGVRWWQSSRPGCSTRNTMNRPRDNSVGIAALFHPDDATVVHGMKRGTTEARFRLALHGPPGYVDVVLVATGGQVIAASTGAHVNTVRMRTLEIPYEGAR